MQLHLTAIRHVRCGIFHGGITPAPKKFGFKSVLNFGFLDYGYSDCNSFLPFEIALGEGFSGSVLSKIGKGLVVFVAVVVADSE